MLINLSSAVREHSGWGGERHVTWIRFQWLILSKPQRRRVQVINAFHCVMALAFFGDYDVSKYYGMDVLLYHHICEVILYLLVRLLLGPFGTGGIEGLFGHHGA